jgi:TetR/AcrR family transcriptional repressor of nem operon
MEPVEARTQDRIARIFALLDRYRNGMVQHGCRMGCPIGNLALEVSDGNPEARRLIHRNFENWASRVEGWLVEAGDRLAPDIDRSRLARFILTVMEGGLMQSRAANDLGPFDESVAVLREHLNLLLRSAAERGGRSRNKKRLTGGCTIVRPRACQNTGAIGRCAIVRQ